MKSRLVVIECAGYIFGTGSCLCNRDTMKRNESRKALAYYNTVPAQVDKNAELANLLLN